MMDVPVYKRFDFRVTDVRVNRYRWRNAERLRLVARLAADLRFPAPATHPPAGLGVIMTEFSIPEGA